MALIDDKKLDELLALAEQNEEPRISGFWAPKDASVQPKYPKEAEDWYFPEELALLRACDPATIRALVQEVKDWRASSPYLGPPR
jgi:hypothetical protein